MEEKADYEPGGEGQPFGEGEVTRENGKKFHQNEEKRDKSAESGDETQAWSRFHKKEGETRGEPAEGRGHGTHFRDGNENGIA